MLRVFFSLSLAFVPISTKFNSRIVNGYTADIRQFSYSAFMNTICNEYTIKRWRCGASIINQNVLLTAAHCLAPCRVKAKVMVSVGSADRDQVNMIEAKDYRTHELYRVEVNSNFLHDIGVILLKCPLKFSDKVGRIILMPNPPIDTTAFVAGWGGTENKRISQKLVYAPQEVFTRESCNKLLRVKKFQEDCICAGFRNATMYPAPGDSGSALVVRKAVQIGIVSYRKLNVLHIAVYTDVSKHYNWIMRTMRDMLFCNENATKYNNCSNNNLNGTNKMKRPHNLRSNVTDSKSGVQYAASITTTCEDTFTGGLKKETTFCGASIINERLLLSAAICLVCRQSDSYATVLALVGSDRMEEGKKLKVKEYKIHELYNSDPVMNNIAVLLLEKPLVFNERIDTVVLTSNPQYDEPAKVVRSPEYDDSTDSFSVGPLVHTNQQLLSKSYCQSVITPLPPDSLCAAVDEEIYLAPGNALVVKDSVQIGLVSFRVGGFVVYTDTGRFFDWINSTAENFFKGE